MILVEPLKLVDQMGKVDVFVNAQRRRAVRPGRRHPPRHLPRARATLNPEFRPVLKKAGFLTRDARAVERKKYGQPGARKRFQFSKR